MTYRIGTPGVAWGDAERAAWRAQTTKQRSYEDDVLAVVDRLRARSDLEVVEYGPLAYGDDGVFPLFAIRTRGSDATLPTALVTGGVHGYETSGVHGALRFVEERSAHYAPRANVLVAPCVSPWAYERIQRWNANAVDPNRSFSKDGRAEESLALMRLLAPLTGRVLLHIDLHETTDTDESEFRPAREARDGKEHVPGVIPDGFYLVDDTENPRAELQAAIIDAVAMVTHIAPADADGKIIGSAVVAPGVIRYPLVSLGLCAGMTGATYTTTTEVYPDSPRTTPDQCIAAQVAAVQAAIEHVLGA